MRTSKEFRDQIVTLNVPADRLAFWWLGQHSWIVKTQNHILALDPYLADDPRRLVKPVLDPEDCDFFDCVLCTHEHSDHFDKPALEAMARVSTNTKFIVPKVVQAQAQAIGLAGDNVVLLDAQTHAEYIQENLHVISIPAAHEFVQIDPQTGSRWLGFIINVDGFCVYHSGDTCYYDGLLPTICKHAIDIAFVPINGRDGKRYRNNTIGNLTYQEAVDLLGQANVKLACPAHHGMFAHNTEDPQLFADFMNAKFPAQQYWIGQPHELVWYDKP